MSNGRQRERVIAIDVDTAAVVATESPGGSRSLRVARLLIVPAIGFLAALPRGIVAAGNRWAFLFALEAKRYERDYGNRRGPERIAGTFSAGG
jgi:hypothetical protein